MAKQSKYDQALAHIDARLGALRDIANYLDEHREDASATANRDIEALQYARNLLTSAVDGPTNGSAKPKRQRTKKTKTTDAARETA